MVLIGAVAYGIAIRRSQHTLPGSSVLFILSGPIGLLLSIIHFPSSTMIFLTFAYFGFGKSLKSYEA